MARIKKGVFTHGAHFYVEKNKRTTDVLFKETPTRKVQLYENGIKLGDANNYSKEVVDFLKGTGCYHVEYVSKTERKPKNIPNANVSPRKSITIIDGNIYYEIPIRGNFSDVQLKKSYVARHLDKHNVKYRVSDSFKDQKKCRGSIK
jgi:hypothetical protein